MCTRPDATGSDQKSVSICGCRKELWPRIDTDETRFRKPNQGTRNTANGYQALLNQLGERRLYQKRSPAIAFDARSKILSIDRVDEADVQLVWDPVEPKHDQRSRADEARNGFNPFQFFQSVRVR